MAQMYLSSSGKNKEELQYQIDFIRAEKSDTRLQSKFLSVLYLQGFLYGANYVQHYREHGILDTAEETYRREFKESETTFGGHHSLTLGLQFNLARMLSSQGKWEEAKELFVQVMETHLKVQGQEHPDTLSSMVILAMTLSRQGLWGEAEELFAQVMESRKMELGEDHPLTLVSMGNSAWTFSEQGR